MMMHSSCTSKIAKVGIQNLNLVSNYDTDTDASVALCHRELLKHFYWDTLYKVTSKLIKRIRAVLLKVQETHHMLVGLNSIGTLFTHCTK